MTYKPEFRIIGRCTSGVRVDGYVIQSEIDGTRRTASKAEVESLALNKQIVNCDAQVWNDRVYMKGKDCKLSEFPLFNLDGTPCNKIKQPTKNIPIIDIVARVSEGKNIRGYVISIETRDGNVQKTVSREDILKLAQKGLVKNARAQNSKDSVVLRGVNSKLAALPQYKI